MLAPGRQVYVEPLHIDMTDMDRGAQKTGIIGAKGEVPSGDSGRAGGEIVRIDIQIFACNLEAAQQGNIKVAQLRAGVETFGKRLQQPSLQNRLCAGNDHVERSYREHEHYE